MKPIRLLILSFLIPLSGSIFGQQIAVKNNLLYDATLTPNIGVEIGLAPKWTFDLSGQLNAWKVKRHSWKHWRIQPEVRYWFCRRFSAHFVGAHLLGGQYNIGNLDLPFSMLGTDFRKLKDSRYQGWYGGAGIAYGYSRIINRHWNIEGEVGMGWVYTRYDQYPCAECGTKTAHNVPHHYFGPTKAAINLIYVF